MTKKKTTNKKSKAKPGKVGYMCLVDFDFEMDPDVHEGIPVFSSIKHLRKARPCTYQCGIAKVRVTLEKVSQKPDYKPEKD